jgi:hypothetical protein
MLRRDLARPIAKSRQLDTHFVFVRRHALVDVGEFLRRAQNAA